MSLKQEEVINHRIRKQSHRVHLRKIKQDCMNNFLRSGAFIQNRGFVTKLTLRHKIPLVSRDPAETPMVPSQEVIRPLTNFPPSIWGDQFVIYDEVKYILLISTITI